jgi:cytochrome c biogenesis protein
VVLLVGALIGSIKGYKGVVNIPEGESVDTIQLLNTGQSLRLPFTIKCEDFDVQFYKTGAPKEFRSRLVLILDGKLVLKKDVVVNDPIRYKGINIFQSSYDKIQSVDHDGIKLADVIALSFQSKASGMIYSRKTKLNQTVAVPEGAGTFVVNDYNPTAKFKGMEIGPAFIGKLIPKQGDAESIILPLKFSRFDAMRGGDFIISVDNAPPVQTDRYSTGLQVTRDPGVGLVYFGFILMIIGCVITFFLAHQQVVVELQPKGNKVAVMVSGKANKNKISMQYYLARLATKLSVLNISEPV